jgi:serine/threonine protein kinase
LPDGTRLGEFELLKVLGVGGFGIVYLAFDHALEREVAVKEYMPASLAGRTETMHVSLRSQSDAETFELGRKSFVNEAKLLARFDHPSLLKVHRFWEANGTAYMAMPVMRGRTVKDVRADMEVPPTKPGCVRCSTHCWAPLKSCTAKVSTTATSRPTTSRSNPTAAPCCWTLARRGVSSATRARR